MLLQLSQVETSEIVPQIEEHSLTKGLMSRNILHLDHEEVSQNIQLPDRIGQNTL